MSRIEPLNPPYTADTDRALRRWMPPGVPHEPLALFRVLHRNPELASRMFALGAGLLGHGLLPAMDREIVIARVTARSGCAYEWGVHAATLSPRAGLGPELLRATAQPDAVGSASWSPRHTALLHAVDELDGTAQLTQSAWDALRVHYDEAQLLELLVLAGWYRTISLLANGLLLEEEPWGARFPEPTP
ncbi:alkylhydroperoxidase family enzyme [Streptomyces sp. KhCrAH-43]|uniref:carboxymuconolactone decarboxylase family protein n=1 Tax=Streptomyces TaxID=1883 RepID=UPI0003776433|nr:MULTISPECIES: carboxymuconolactone decarboxylase family protein [unclassified Streptomyces]MYS39286.1 carboxymuconolactone decarboxylase family protein [Streptomyces sp. SID4920]MYX69601.1 carboxymuconolactone decarboxylase family protein [Streptomyces sp. SID8373]RAJ59536.1 alkylhydroperoxidase family enzyme [Streptomyces sp. KhCrAH-43]